MATFIVVHKFSEDLAKKVHDMELDSFKWYLTNVAPVQSTSFLKSDLGTEASGTGYSAGGASVNITTNRSNGVTTVSTPQLVITAGAGGITGFRYLVLYNDTPTSPLDPVVGYLDHGSTVTMAQTDTYTIPASAVCTIGS
jgi:hypothetical protein